MPCGSDRADPGNAEDLADLGRGKGAPLGNVLGERLSFEELHYNVVAACLSYIQLAEVESLQRGRFDPLILAAKAGGDDDGCIRRAVLAQDIDDQVIEEDERQAGGEGEDARVPEGQAEGQRAAKRCQAS